MRDIDRDSLVADLLGRSASLFGSDIGALQDRLRPLTLNERVLVTGAAGSIGAAVVRELVAMGARALVLVDPDENGLVELVRELRSARSDTPELSTYAIGIGSLEFQRLLGAIPPPDRVISLAALKHVRSERDEFTLMRLLHTNVLAVDDLLAQLPRDLPFFSVSSDKAVRPASAMGASKAWMERVLMRAPVVGTSARFANVAFSAGSLLDGFLNRLRKRQPLAAPLGVRRYFISEREAAQLCLLATYAGAAGDILVPATFSESDARPLDEVARVVLRHAGLKPVLCATEAEARAHPALRASSPSEWPCFFATADTSGEKPIEEFTSPSEHVSAFSPNVRAVRLGPARGDPAGALAQLRALRQRGEWSKDDLTRLLRLAIPEFDHVERGRSLDARM